jgi:hypothetical protein
MLFGLRCCSWSPYSADEPLAGTEKPLPRKATNETTNPLGVLHGLVARHPSLNGGGEWRKLARLNETEELLAGHVGVHPVRHRSSGVSGGLEAQEEKALQMRRSAGSGTRARRKNIMGKKSLEPIPDAWF